VARKLYLGEIKGRRGFEMIQSALFNLKGVDCGGVIVGNDDNVATYLLVVEPYQGTAAYARELTAYVHGYRDALCDAGITNRTHHGRDLTGTFAPM
jgi:hypothetical protein